MQVACECERFHESPRKGRADCQLHWRGPEVLRRGSGGLWGRCCGPSRSPCRDSQTSAADTTPSGNFFLIPRCRLGHSRTSMGWSPVRTFEIKDFRPFHSHNHTQCTAYACERHARTQPRWSPSIWNGSGTFECKVKSVRSCRVTACLPRGPRSGVEVSSWVRVTGHGRGRESVQREHVQGGVEGGVRGRVHRAVAQVGPGGGVADYGQHEIVDRVLAGASRVIGAVPAVGLVQELAYHLAQVQGVGGPLAALPLLFDPADDARVEAEPGAEGEPAVGGTASSSVPGVPAARPRPIVRSVRSRSASRIAPVASTASFGRPRARAKTFVEPPGTTARRGRRSGSGPWWSRPLTTSFTVPSPPRATTSSMSSESAARRPRSRACPRYSVVRPRASSRWPGRG